MYERKSTIIGLILLLLTVPVIALSWLGYAAWTERQLSERLSKELDDAIEEAKLSLSKSTQCNDDCLKIANTHIDAATWYRAVAHAADPERRTLLSRLGLDSAEHANCLSQGRFCRPRYEITILEGQIAVLREAEKGCPPETQGVSHSQIEFAAQILQLSKKQLVSGDIKYVLGDLSLLLGHGFRATYAAQDELLECMQSLQRPMQPA